LQDPDFFPGLGKALAPNLVSSETLAGAAKDLYERLDAVIPKIHDRIDEWSAWPFLRLELPEQEVGKLKAPSSPEKLKVAHDIIHQHGSIVKSDARIAQIFGLAGLPDNFKISELISTWKERVPGTEATWFESCCEQIMVGAQRGFPIIRWTPLREADGQAEFTPVLSRIKRIPFSKTVQFDIYFYNLADPRAVPATSRMIAKADFFYKEVGKAAPDSFKLGELVRELEARGLNRVPILQEGRALYIIHRSMIDRFIAQRLWASSGVNVEAYTLADVLLEPDLKIIFETSFVVVNKHASLAEAKSSMLGRPGCSDVFITERGQRDEPVIGWLTNVDITRSI
jgi:hypothetical protein